MNNFDGQLDLYPEICIDNFSSDLIYNFRIRTYMLTHFHDDHMKNLEDPKFYNLLKENSEYIKFYCSHITKKFIQTCDKYEHLDELCHEVACESPFIVNISNKETVTVTFCGSGHCPGSVMVFIEGSRGNVLFTGDFRLPLNTASRLPFLKENLHDSSLTIVNKKSNSIEQKAKSVDNLYVDMTFFKTEIQYIPTRKESVNALIKFLKDFLKGNEGLEYFQNLVYMKTSARIGYEYVYQEIFNETGYKVHVNDLIYKIYDKLPKIQESLTVDPYATPIHCCIYENKKRDVSKSDLMCSAFKNKPIQAQQSPNKQLRKDFNISSNFKNSMGKKMPAIPCMLVQNENNPCLDRSLRINAIKVILSAMWFTDTAGVDKILVEYKPAKNELGSIAYKYYKSIYRLCYSFHSSLEEIVDFVDTLRPKKLYSIALPDSTTDKIINEYFFNLSGNFVGYHVRKALTNDEAQKIKNRSQSDRVFGKCESSDKLVLRKRTSFECFNENSTSSDSSKSDDFCFDNNDHSSDEMVESKKFKI